MVLISLSPYATFDLVQCGACVGLLQEAAQQSGDATKRASRGVRFPLFIVHAFERRGEEFRVECVAAERVINEFIVDNIRVFKSQSDLFSCSF